jgi:hypothetical protein
MIINFLLKITGLWYFVKWLSNHVDKIDNLNNK